MKEFVGFRAKAQTRQIIFCIRKHEWVTNNSLIRIYINRIENKIILRIRTGYYLELLMSGKMKLLGRTKIKNENGLI